MTLAVITIGIDPFIHLGPVTLAWHGITIAIGIAVGGLLASRDVKRRGMSAEPIQTIIALTAVGGIVGAKILYIVESGGLARPDEWLGTNGFTFAGGLILGAALVIGYVVRARLDPLYIDIAAAALPLGVAVGRIGDVINGEHYGDRTDFFLGVRNSHPDATVPDHAAAYHSGGLYEVLLSLLIFAVVWPRRDRLGHPTSVAWIVLAMFGAGRFFEFFLRSDDGNSAVGLTVSQWSCVAIVVASAVGWEWSRRRFASRVSYTT